MGVLAKYKVIDPSEYGLQNITPLMPILFHDSVFYFGGLVISKDDLNKNTNVPIITKYTNGLIDVERLLIHKYFFNVKTLTNFRPLLLTNRERLLLAQEAVRMANFPPVTRFEEYYGVLEFGNYGNKEKSPSGRLQLNNDGSITASLVSISDKSTKLFNKIIQEKIDQPIDVSLKEINQMEESEK